MRPTRGNAKDNWYRNIQHTRQQFPKTLLSAHTMGALCIAWGVFGPQQTKVGGLDVSVNPPSSMHALKHSEKRCTQNLYIWQCKATC